MTLQASTLTKKVAPASDNREQQDATIVYGGTGEVAMNDGRINAIFILHLAANGRVSTTVV
jgi:hypothetical protein